MRVGLIFGTISFLLLLITGCSSMYLPNVPATPMFTNAGEGYLAAHSNVKGNLSGSAGVAFTEHLAVVANGSYMDIKTVSEEFKQKLVEGSLGYYTVLGHNKRNVLEFYGGYGIGSTLDMDKRASTTGSDPVEVREMDFNKIFVQANFSSTRKNKLRIFGKERVLNYGTAIRINRIKMDGFKLNYEDSSPEENVYLEPVFFTRLELNKGFQLQYTNGWNIGLMDNEYLKAGNAVFTLGLIYNFGKKK